MKYPLGLVAAKRANCSWTLGLTPFICTLARPRLKNVSYKCRKYKRTATKTGTASHSAEGGGDL
eukprot:scaffold8246_cov127-Skeletonema_marinoi.AAC.2